MNRRNIVFLGSLFLGILIVGMLYVDLFKTTVEGATGDGECDKSCSNGEPPIGNKCSDNTDPVCLPNNEPNPGNK